MAKIYYDNSADLSAICRKRVAIIFGHPSTIDGPWHGERERHRARAPIRASLRSRMRAGLKPILALGHKFDPNFHQAMVHDERDDLEENMVIEEYQRGYTFQGRLLRAMKRRNE